jgi:hypothetical protein
MSIDDPNRRRWEMGRGFVLSAGVVVLAWALAGMSRAADESKGILVTIDGFMSRTPAGWEAEKTTNRFRKYQFRLAGKDGKKSAAQLLVLDLGGSGGGTEANIKRWQGMFEAPDGKTIDEVTKVAKMKIAGVPVVYMDIHGTYLERFPPFDPNARITRRPNYRRLNIIFDSKNGPFFITVAGPAATIAQHKAEFDSWLKGFKK